MKKEGDKMNYIGEFQKDSTILLELLTKGEENQSIPVDYPPTAVIEHYERNGRVKVDSVTLETMGDQSRHTKAYRIPSDWKQGDYLITYQVFVDGEEHSVQEKFRIAETKVTLKNISPFLVDDTDEVDDEPVTSADGYIMPSEFQIPSTIEVDGNKITISLTGGALYNHTYRVVLGSSIASVSGERLEDVRTLTFTSEYKPLFATPLEVRSVLRSMYKYFTTHDVHAAIRDAGQKALQMKGSTVDANSSRYREMRSSDATLFPTQKYVMYEASRMLMTSLMVRILNGADDDIEGGLGMINESGGSIALGDFSVSNTSSDSSVSGAQKREETPLQKLKALIEQTERELKFWMDAMMGHNRRGYAKPSAGSFRTDAGSPEGRDFA